MENSPKDARFVTLVMRPIESKSHSKHCASSRSQRRCAFRQSLSICSSPNADHGIVHLCISGVRVKRLKARHLLLAY